MSDNVSRYLRRLGQARRDFARGIDAPPPCRWETYQQALDAAWAAVGPLELDALAHLVDLALIYAADPERFA